MTSLLSVPLGEVLDRIAAPTAAPGGGAAAALAGSLGAAVGAMVASLPRSRHDTPEERARLEAAAVALAAHRAALARLAEADTAVVMAMMAAAKSRLAAPPNHEPARARLAEAAREATRVPLETARHSGDALEALREVAACGARVATSDVLVAVSLLKAAADGAAANVRANLATLGDEVFVRDSTHQLTRALDGAARAAHAVLAALQD